MTILSKLISLYLLIFLGYISVRLLKIQKETFARLLIYIISPTVVFWGTYTANLELSTLSLPLLFFGICAIISLLAQILGRFAFKEHATKQLFILTCATANSGYFGIPVALILFGQDMFSSAVLIALGFTSFENTIGFYTISRGNHSIRDSLRKVSRLPAIYAFALGVLCNALLGPTAIPETIPNMFKGAYSILGMMMVGIGLSNVKLHHIDKRFIILQTLMKFALWPILMLLIIALDILVFHVYTSTIYRLFIMMAIMPSAANTVAFATECKVHPDKAAVAVLISTLIALIYVPLIARVF